MLISNFFSALNAMPACGSITFCCGSGSGSGSADPCLDPDADPDATIFSSLTFKMLKKLIKTKSSAYNFLKIHLHQFSKIKSKKSHKAVGAVLFLLWRQKDPDQDPNPNVGLMDPDPDPRT
jgi:hypothetical protein